MSKIIVSIVAILLIFFPNSKSLISYNQQITYNSAIGAEKIIEAFKNEDVDALEKLMCKNINNNVENLPNKIQDLFDAVDGEIIEATYESRGGSYSGSNPGKGSITQSGVFIYITTTKNIYDISFWWETVNTYQPEETGIRAITLAKTDTNEILGRISATDGIGNWHD